MPDIQIYRSESRPWAIGATIAIPTSYLDPARKMVSPEIESIDIHATLLINTAAGITFLGGQGSQVFDKVQLADPAGDRLNLRGSSLRQVNLVEYGDGFLDPANIPASQTNAVLDFYLRIPIHPLKARRRADFRIPLMEFLDGGSLNMYIHNSATLGALNSVGTVQSGTFELITRVVECRKRELKSRICWIDYDITQQEYSYGVGGSLRYAMAYVGELNEFSSTQVTWSTTQQITSRTLDLSNIPFTWFKADYVRKTFSLNAANDGVQNNFLLPLLSAQQDQKIPQMADMSTVHFKTDTALPANGPQKMIICSITDRASTLSMRTFRAANQSALTAKLNSSYVKTQQGTRTSDKVQNWGNGLSMRMPLKQGAAT